MVRGTAIALVLGVGRVGGDTASLLLGCIVNLRVVGEARDALLGGNLGDSSAQRGLAMVDGLRREDKPPEFDSVFLSYIPTVLVFEWGFARENFVDAGSA